MRPAAAAAQCAARLRGDRPPSELRQGRRRAARHAGGAQPPDPRARGAARRCALFHRRTRAIELTEAGRLIYPGLHAGFESVRGAIGAARSRRATATFWSSARRRACRQMADAAAVALPARASGDRCARLGQHEARGFRHRGRRCRDPAEQGHASPISMSRSCSTIPCCRCAAPRLVEQGLRSAADLARFPLIHYDIPTSMHAPPLWADWFAVAGLAGIDATRGLQRQCRRPRARRRGRGRRGVALATS